LEGYTQGPPQTPDIAGICGNFLRAFAFISFSLYPLDAVFKSHLTSFGKEALPLFGEEGSGEI